MGPWLRAGAALAGSAGAAGLAAATLGTRRWDRQTADLVGRLEAAAREATAASRVSRTALADLPDAAARYFRFALAPDQRRVRRARLRQGGDFRMRPPTWHRFTATQHFSVEPPGFVWDAAIRIGPLLRVRVRDSYLGGEGAMRAALWGAWPLVDQRGTPEIAAGSLLRYLAEAAWLPTALLPSRAVTWAKADDRTATITLTDRGTTVSLHVEIGPRGEIVRGWADRYRDANGRGVLTPWTCEYRDYVRVEGMMVPTSAEVAWILPDGPFAYWRGRIAAAEYEFAA